MAPIDCKLTAECGLTPTEYVDQFVRRGGDSVLLATDEEENGFTKLNADSAEFLARRLRQLVQEIRANQPALH